MSDSIHPMDGELKIEPIEYSETEKNYRQWLIRRLCDARDNREKKHIEFDDQSYSDWYDKNRKADLAYLSPKKDKYDDRLTTGMTREKDTAMLSFLLNMKMEPSLMVFDEDDVLLAGLGQRMGLCISKSRELEDYELVRPLIYREYIAQGDVFVEEVWEETFTTRKIITNEWTPEKPIESYKHEEMPSIYCRKAVSRLIEGKKVYLGDMTIENIKDQPYIFTYEIMTRDEAKSIYGKWSRWKNVPDMVQTISAIAEGDADWALHIHDKNYVGVLKYQDKNRNEYQILLNGVMMMPVGYPLTMINPSGEFSIAQGKYESIQNFAYSKSQPSKSKVEQGMLDEMYKLMFMKIKQSLKPPSINMSGKVITGDIFLPGKITTGVQPGEVTPLMQTLGVNNSEFSFFNLIKESIDDKTINRSFAGQQAQGDPTATQIMEEKNQQLSKLGLSIDGIVALERQLAWNRLYTIIHHWTSEESEMLKENMAFSYNKLHMEDSLENGEKGMRVIEFRNDLEEYVDEDEMDDEEMNAMKMQEHYDEEEKMSKEYNKPVRITYINPKMLKEFKGMWYVMIIPSEKNNDTIKRMLFIQNVQEAQQIFGPESLNYNHLKQRFANYIGEDPMKMFTDIDITQMQSALLQNNQGQGGGLQAPQPNQSATMGNPRRGLSLKTALGSK